MRYFFNKGYRFSRINFDRIPSTCTDGHGTLLFYLIEIYNREAMMCLLKCRYQNIYDKGYVWIENYVGPRLTPLALLTTRIINNNNSLNMQMFGDFVRYIMTNVDQFGDERTVYNYIIQSGAEHVILKFNNNNIIRKHVIQMQQNYVKSIAK